MISKTLAVGVAAALSILASGCSTTASTTGASSTAQATGTGPLSPEDKHSLADGYRDTLNRLYETTPGSRELVGKAAGVLVFPRAVSAGFVVGAEYGKGELRSHGNLQGYYRTTSGSIGLQIGAQSRALVFLFMTQDALKKFRDSKGFSAGVDGTVAVLKVGANGAVDVNAAQEPVVAFVMTNAGLMANLSVSGTKITEIQ